MSLHLCLSNNHAEHKFTLLELTMKPQVCIFWWKKAPPQLSMILKLLDLLRGGLPNRDLGNHLPTWWVYYQPSNSEGLTCRCWKNLWCMMNGGACGIVALWTCGLFVFWQKVDRNKVSRRWCQLASRMHNVFTFVSKQQSCWTQIYAIGADDEATGMYLLMKESSSQIEHDFRVARSLVRRPPKQGFGQPLANMMSLLSTIKFRRLDLPMLKKSLMHDEWWCLWYCGIVDLWSVCVLAEGG